MPVYVYRNLVTNETFELHQSITDDPLTVDPRTGDLFEIQTSSSGVRERYAEAAARQRGAIAAAIRAAGADHLQLRTDRDWLLDIVHFVAQRRDRTRDIAPRTSA